MVQVPQFDFTTFKFVVPLRNLMDLDTHTEWAWAGASQPVQRIALAVMGLGQILPITPPALNTTWTLDFWGPALQCNDIVGTERDRIWTSIWNTYSSSIAGTYAFISWVPRSYPNGLLTATDADQNLPFVFDNSSHELLSGLSSSTLSNNEGNASLFVSVLPGMQDISFVNSMNGTSIISPTPDAKSCQWQRTDNLTGKTNFGCLSPNSTLKPLSAYKDSTLLRCDLVNTSYSIDFNYSNSVQNIGVSSNMMEDSRIVNSSYLFVGPGSSDDANCSRFLTDPDILYDQLQPPCVFDSDAVRILSYQGIMTAFNTLLVGNIRINNGTFNPNTSIMRTILAETEELSFLQNMRFPKINNDLADLQTFLSSSPGWAYPGLMSSTLPESGLDLRSTLERLFQNFTISLLAEPYLQ